MAQSIDELLSRLDEINLERTRLNNEIYKRNRSWAINLSDTYLKIIPKDIYNIIYKMNPPTWYFNNSDDTPLVFPCLRCNAHISCYKSIKCDPGCYLMVQCEYCASLYIGKEIEPDRSIFRHIMIKNITKFLSMQMVIESFVALTYFTNINQDIRQRVLTSNINADSLFRFILDDDTIIYMNG